MYSVSRNWMSWTKKTSLMLSASCWKRSSRSRRACSVRFRSVMSSCTARNRAIAPRAARVGDEHRRRALIDREREPAELHLRALALDGVPDHPREQMALDPPLHEVVLGTGAHGLEREGLVVQTGNHDDRLPGGAVMRAMKRLDPFAVGQAEVQEYNIHGGPAQPLGRRREPVPP